MVTKVYHLFAGRIGACLLWILNKSFIIDRKSKISMLCRSTFPVYILSDVAHLSILKAAVKLMLYIIERFWNHRKAKQLFNISCAAY